MSEFQESADQTNKTKPRMAIMRDYFLGGSGREFDTYRDPELYDRGAHSHLYRRDNLARGVADITEAHLPRGRDTSILDIGAGTGILSLELAGRNHSVTALDLFQPQLTRLREKAAVADLSPLIKPIQADMNNSLPFVDDSFASVVSLRATRYIRNFNGWVNEVYRVLEPGASFVLPVFAIDIIPWKRNSDKGIRQPTTHQNVMDVIIDAGFEINEAASVRYTNAVDMNLGQRDVPLYYRPDFVVATASA